MQWGGVGGDEKAKLRWDLYLWGWWFDLPHRNQLQKQGRFPSLFHGSTVRGLGSQASASQNHSGPRFPFAFCSKGMSFFPCDQSWLLNTTLTSHLVTKVKEQEEVECKQYPFKNATQNCTYHIHSHPLAQNLVTPTCTKGREVQTVEMALHLPKLGTYVAKRKKGDWLFGVKLPALRPTLKSHCMPLSLS